MTCKDCIHDEVCGGYTPTDLDKDVFNYCQEGRADEIPDIEKRCGNFKNKADFVEVVRCEKCKHGDVSIMALSKDGEEYIGCYCNLKNIVTDIDGFCNYGKKEIKERF